MDPDADPGGPKTYGSYGSGSAPLVAILFNLNNEYRNKFRGCVFGPPRKKACVHNCDNIQERVHKKERLSLLLPRHKHIYLKRIWRMCQTVKGLGELLAYQVYFDKNAFLFFIITVVVRCGSIRNCEIAHSALANLENLRNCVLRTTETKLWNCVLRTWKTYCAAHLWLLSYLEESSLFISLPGRVPGTDSKF